MKKVTVLFICVLLLSSCHPITQAGEGDAYLVMNEYDIAVNLTEESEPEDEDEPAPLTAMLVPKPEDVISPEEITVLYSGGLFMYNVETDTVVFKKNEHGRYPPASIAKIMTLLVVLDNVSDLNALVEVTYEAFADFDNGDPNMEDAAGAKIEQGQTNLSYLDCLYALILPSACEAANILAYNAGGGSIPNFIDMMNDKATELGCLNTNFTNASGLYEEDYYSSAYDMFLITKYTLDKYPLFEEIYKSPFHSMPPNDENPEGYFVRNTSAGLRVLHEMDFAEGIKIGSIYEYFHGSTRIDGFLTFVSMAEKDGLTFITVSLDADYYNDEGKWSGFHYDDHAALYEWAYEVFEIEEY
ncbi:MAG: hypothetical protein FWG70_05305 [Oscillospiraceae bacterium]|nr:hypothetical protein [Oscillospiraceae bacterium]